MNTVNRSMMEARIVVLALLNRMAQAGYTYIEVDDGGDADEIQRGLSIEQAMDAIFAVHDAHVFFSKAAGAAKGWVLIIPSNGCDVVSDWGISPKMVEFNDLLDAFDGDVAFEDAMKLAAGGVVS